MLLGQKIAYFCPDSVGLDILTYGGASQGLNNCLFVAISTQILEPFFVLPYLPPEHRKEQYTGTNYNFHRSQHFITYCVKDISSMYDI